MVNPIRKWWGRRKRKPEDKATISDIASILGKSNVIEESSVKKVLRIRRFLPLEPLYSIGTVERYAEENAQGEEYLLYPKYGLSPSELHRIAPEEFSPSVVWSMKYQWLSMSSRPWYVLLNFKPQMIGYRKKKRAYFFAKYHLLSRVKISTAIEVLVTRKLISNACCLPYSYHCGGTTENVIPIVGNYNQNGLLVYTLPQGALDRYGLAQLGVIMCVSPEFPIKGT